jgi:hypothetical protein
MTRTTALLVFAALGALGCGPEFEKQATLTSLRVLGVRKDKPYAKPGDTVKLTMLYDDATLAGADAAPKQRDVKIVWISPCKNPDGDLYLGCLPQIIETFGNIKSGDVGKGSCELLGLSGLGIPGVLDCGPEYSYPVSPTIIAEHARPRDTSEPYGLAYIFFLVCAGEIGVAPAGQQFPLACFSKSGEQLGANDFVVGYTALYSYATFQNPNPKVTGFTVGVGEDVKINNVPPLCFDEECVVGAGMGGPVTLDAGVLDAGVLDAGDAGPDAAVEAGMPPPEGGSAPVETDPCKDPESPACFEVCTEEKQSDCPEHDIKLETSPDSVDFPDDVTVAREHREIYEQAWINYYTDQGELVNDVKLLGDANEGYQPNHGTKIRAPKKLGPFHVWGVAHDSRGGVGWAKVLLGTRRAK